LPRGVNGSLRRQPDNGVSQRRESTRDVAAILCPWITYNTYPDAGPCRDA
jgi:hypothetical protein